MILNAFMVCLYAVIHDVTITFWVPTLCYLIFQDYKYKLNDV